MTNRIQAFSLTDTGRKRENNQDACAVFSKRDLLLMIVADGVGGNLCGEVASRIAVETMQKRFAATAEIEPKSFLIQGVREANRRLRAYVAAHPECRGMATTLTAAVIRYPHLHLLHVGDSRAYLLRNRHLQQLTEDHTLVRRMVREGVISPAEAETHPKRHVIINAIGVAEEQRFDYLSYDLIPGDQVLLCSDGLYDELENTTIRTILQNSPPKEAIRNLIDAANAAGGRDNISIALATLEGTSLSDTKQMDADLYKRPAKTPRRLSRWIIALCCLGVLAAGTWFLTQTSAGRKVLSPTVSQPDRFHLPGHGSLAPGQPNSPDTH